MKSKIKIALLENIHPVAGENLRAQGFDVQMIKHSPSDAEIISTLSEVQVLGIRSKTRLKSEVLRELKSLQLIGAFCIGTDQVDLKAAKNFGVPVFNAPYSNTRSVAELVLCEIIALARQLGDRSMAAHKGIWLKNSDGSHEVRGKTLGIIGYGHIGSQVSILAESFGMKVLFFDIAKKLPLGNSVSCDTLSEVLNRSDFVTLHVPDTAQTKNMIGEKQIAQMKKGSLLINASRGSVVDIPALASALKQKHIAGAAIDVFPQEPASNQDKFVSELQGLENVILTPHVGGSTEEAQEAIGIEVAASLTEFLKRGSTLGAVNFPNVNLPIQHENSHRLLNVHKNVPGVLSEINGIVSELGANIHGQYLATDASIGYLVMDMERGPVEKIAERVQELETSIRTRHLA